MKIELICVGKLKEKYLQQACEEYKKRLQSYAKVEIKEVAEEKWEPKSDAEIAQVLEKEGQRIAQLLHPNTYLIALAIEGKNMSSLEFAHELERISIYGTSHITFLIGGSYGLSPELLNRANLLLSFSKMTFPHQLIRVFLLEQIYRAFKIQRGETYHK